MHGSLGFPRVCLAAPNSLATCAAVDENLAFLNRSVQAAGEMGFFWRGRRHSRILKKGLLSCGAGLWGLVNNAGIASFGDVEFTSVEKYQRVADINLWGTIRVTKAFLPLIRRARGRKEGLEGLGGTRTRF